MTVYVKNKNIFVAENGFDTSPRIINKRLVAGEEILTIELGCLLDQRVLLEEDIDSIKIFLSSVSYDFLNRRRSPFLESFDSKGTQKKSLLTDKDPSDAAIRQKLNDDSQRGKSKLDIASDLSDVIFDLNRISQQSVDEKFRDLKFMTKIDVNQFLKPLRIKNIQGSKQTDEELFGTRKIFRIDRTRNSVLRQKKGTVKKVNLESLIRDRDQSIPGINYFKNVFFDNVKKGIDPISYFTDTDVNNTIERKQSGSISILKNRKEDFRRKFKSFARESLSIPQNEDLGFDIVTQNVSNRNRFCKTTFELSRNKLKKFASSGLLHFIFFAFDRSNKKIDSSGISFSLDSLFATGLNPPLDFDLGTVRLHRGSVKTKINNRETQTNRFNLYQKAYSNSQNYKKTFFTTSIKNVIIDSNSDVTVTDGRLSNTNSSSPTISKTKNVFQRVTPLFGSREISNTKSSSVSSLVVAEEQMSCTIYVTQNNLNKSLILFVKDLSEDVRAILPVKRTASGTTRGNDFETLKYISDTSGQLVNYSKIFINPEDESRVFNFEDDDVEEGTIYEYGVLLFNKSGHSHISGTKFLEKMMLPEDLVSVGIQYKVQNSSRQNDKVNQSKTSREDRGREINFEITLQRNEDDVDKIIGAIFGDNRSLFDLSSIKDASNLIYGVRVHRINADSGENIFVGSFRGFKQENSNATSSTDIPKTYRVIFSDEPPAFERQIYKFDPFIIPPAQILDKAYAAIENKVFQNPSTKSTLNRQIVSAQSIKNRSIVSKVGSKFASIRGPKGLISSSRAFVEKNKNDVFLEGLTGDIKYTQIDPSLILSSEGNLALLTPTASIIRILDRNLLNKNYVPKRMVELNFSIGPENALFDFYVVVKRFNKDSDVFIDGAIHSKDLSINLNQQTGNLRYTYLSMLDTNIGLVNYYLFGITRSGLIKGPSPIGSILLEGDA